MLLDKLFHKRSSNNEILPDSWLGPYQLTDKDKAVLEAGEEIMIPGYTDKHGKYTPPRYVVIKKDADGVQNITLIARKTFYIELENRVIPDSWLGHTFTDEEKNQLETGAEIEVSDCCISETGKPIDTKTAIAMEELDDGKTFLMLNYKVHMLLHLRDEK